MDHSGAAPSLHTTGPTLHGRRHAGAANIREEHEFEGICTCMPWAPSWRRHPSLHPPGDPQGFSIEGARHQCRVGAETPPARYPTHLHRRRDTWPLARLASHHLGACWVGGASRSAPFLATQRPPHSSAGCAIRNSQRPHYARCQTSRDLAEHAYWRVGSAPRACRISLYLQLSGAGWAWGWTEVFINRRLPVNIVAIKENPSSAGAALTAHRGSANASCVGEPGPWGSS